MHDAIRILHKFGNVQANIDDIEVFQFAYVVFQNFSCRSFLWPG